MGLTYIDITIRNGGDVFNMKSGNIAESGIRQTTVRALADTGAITLVMGEQMRRQLGLIVWESRSVTLGGGRRERAEMAGPVEVQWKDRSTFCDAYIVAEDSEVLLGAIPLEGMDLLVNPVTREVAGVHGDTAVYCLK